MTLPVVWSDEALAQLAGLWAAAADPAAVAAASERLDRQIVDNPFGAGESREYAVRILFDPPLAVRYRLESAKQRVLVLEVGPSRPPR